MIKSHLNSLSSIFGIQKKKINTSLFKKSKEKSLFYNYELLAILKIDNKNNLVIRNPHREIFAKEDSKSFLFTKSISKNFSSKDTSTRKQENQIKNSEIDNNNKSNSPIDINRKTDNKSFSKTTQEMKNIITESHSENTEQIKKYNPESIDKQSNLFNLTDKLPEKIQFYLKLGRYDRPIGFLLLFYPCTWGLTLATPFLDYNYIYHIFLFFSGSVFMRSAGCIINDMWDRDIDKMVERSKTRPLAAGYLSMKEASGFLVLHLALSLVILLKLPVTSIIGGLGIMPIVLIYPFMKRVTYLPQVFLGAAFNSGILVGYPAFEGLVHIEIIFPFYLAGILWTVIYDTIYAHMDKLDDAKINVKSTALYFGNNTKYVLYIINFLMVLFFLIGLNYYEKRYITKQYKNDKKEEEKEIKETPVHTIKLDNKAYYVKKYECEFDIKDFRFGKLDLSHLFLVIGYVYQIHLIRSTNLNDPLSCLKAFKRNSIFGVIIFACCLSKVIKRELFRTKEQIEQTAQ